MGLLRDLLVMANEAERLGMNNGDYFWVFCTGMSAGTVRWGKQNDNITKLLRGAAAIDYADGFSIAGDDDRFLKSWRQQQQQNKNSTCLLLESERTDGLAHVQGIRAVNFSGASGRMWFEEGIINGTFGPGVVVHPTHQFCSSGYGLGGLDHSSQRLWMDTYRTEVDEETGESFGRCGSPDEAWFFFAQVLLASIPVFFAFSMAWRTKAVDDSFSESWWIFAFIFVQLQVSKLPQSKLFQDKCRPAHFTHRCLLTSTPQTDIVSVPLFFILRDLSTDGRHVGLVLLIFIFSGATVLLVMFPKILAFYGIDGGNKAPSQTRGSVRNIRISGLHEQAAAQLRCHIRREGNDSYISTKEGAPS
jgi:hypothetical protein